MELKFEPFDFRKDLAAQRSLFTECFPEVKDTPLVTKAHYHWKFRTFPSSGTYSNSYEYVARIQDDIIGYYAAIPYEYQINGKTYGVAMVCDVMTGVKARGKGVFTKMGLYSTEQFKKEGLAFSTGYPIRPAVIPGHIKAGWNIPFQIPMYGKFLRFDTFLGQRNKVFLAPFANALVNICDFFIQHLVKKKEDVEVETYKSKELENINGLNEFLVQWASENVISLHKSIAFLKWRLSAPDKAYTIFIVKDRKLNIVVGYSIVRSVLKEGVPCLGILDFCFLKGYYHLSKILTQKIICHAKVNKIELVLTMMMREKAKRYKLLSSGFIKTPYPFSFIIKQYDASIEPSILLTESNWSLMWIDSDDL